MAIEVLTKEDLHHFKHDLLPELKKLLKTSATDPQKKWLKSKRR